MWLKKRESTSTLSPFQSFRDTRTYLSLELGQFSLGNSISLSNNRNDIDFAVKFLHCYKIQSL